MDEVAPVDSPNKIEAPTEVASERSLKPIRLTVLLALATVFFITSSLFSYYTARQEFVKWLSPDESANYYFTRLYATTGALTALEPMNQLAADIIRPRSFRSDAGVLKPMSFLGIILVYGKLAALTSVKLIPYFTPIFGAVGIIFFYLLIKEIFGPSTGLISAALLTFFPPYFYYSSRGMFHNVLFVVLLVIGLYFAVAMAKKDRIIAVYDEDDKALKRKARLAKVKNLVPRIVYPALAGGFLGLAAISRTSELLWLAPILIFAWICNLRRVGLIKLIVLLAFFTLAITPVLYWNRELYGSPINSGYPQMNSSIVSLAKTSGNLVQSAIDANLYRQKLYWQQLRDTIFYFGFQPLQSARMFYHYFYRMFGWLFWAALIGCLLFIVDLRRVKGRQVIFFLCWLTSSAVLLFYYGSWEFHDNPDPSQATIGNSYARYWLPIYLGALPFASLLLVKATRLLRYRAFIWSARVFVIALVMIFSIRFLLFGSDEGLVPSAYKKLDSQREAAKVIAATIPDSVIITQYHDKFLFPDRRVIVGLFNDDRMNAEYARLAHYLTVYYYNFTFQPKDLDYLNSTKLAAANLGIRKVQSITKDFTLYQLYATSTPVVLVPKK